MKMQWAASTMIFGMLAVTAGQAQSKSNAAPSVTAANSAAEASLTPQMLTETVHEAWVNGGRNEDKFFDTVKQFAQMSSQKRGVSLPDTEAAGVKMGNLIKTGARRDPDQLLYAVVDDAVRKTAGANITTVKRK